MLPVHLPKLRVDHAKELGRTEDLNAAESGSMSGSASSSGLEEKHWLCPIEESPLVRLSP